MAVAGVFSSWVKYRRMHLNIHVFHFTFVQVTMSSSLATQIFASTALQSQTHMAQLSYKISCASRQPLQTSVPLTDSDGSRF